MFNSRSFGLSALMVLVMVLVAVPASAAPAAGPTPAAACSTQTSVHPLGVDGGLMALRAGELTIQSARSARPLGVDGGLTGLLFARVEAAGFGTHAAVACGSASAGS